MGIPISLDYSWFLIFALITWMLAASYYPTEFKNWPPLLYWFMGAATAIMLFASVLLHELGHSVVALRFKVPVRSITLFVFGGVAQIGAEPPSAKAEFFIAVAGPIVSLALAVFFTVMQPAVAFQSLLGDHSVSQAMSSHCVTIPADLTLQQLVDEHVLGTGRRCFLVNRGAGTVGLMTLHRIKEAPRPDWGKTTAAQVMLPLEELGT